MLKALIMPAKTMISVSTKRVIPSTPFETIEQACCWMTWFENWYNTEHLHSALKFVTPAQRHAGECNDEPVELVGEDSDGTGVGSGVEDYWLEP